MQCPETERCLPAYVVDELVPSEREIFEAHLLGCGECSAELASFAGVKSALPAWSDAPLPASAAQSRYLQQVFPLERYGVVSYMTLYFPCLILW